MRKVWKKMGNAMKIFLLGLPICLSLFSSGKNDVYLAGPLFTLGERQFNKELAGRLRQLGYTVFLPQEQEPRELTSECIFSVDVGGIEDSQIIVAIFDGPDPDSGTSWECGYAYAKKKPIIAVRTDFRGIGDGELAPYNLMLWESAARKVQMPSYQFDLQSLIDEIHIVIQSIFEH
jgi:nucleoside 2-deoxyribosyltransferase